MSLSALQNYMGSLNKCSWVAVKCADPEKQEEVQKRINAELPGNAVQLMRDLPSFERAIPGIDGFIKTILALSTIVSSLVILLATIIISVKILRFAAASGQLLNTFRIHLINTNSGP